VERVCVAEIVKRVLDELQRRPIRQLGGDSNPEPGNDDDNERPMSAKELEGWKLTPEIAPLRGSLGKRWLVAFGDFPELRGSEVGRRFRPEANR
jgi:hypothetical protein